MKTAAWKAPVPGLALFAYAVSIVVFAAWVPSLRTLWELPRIESGYRLALEGAAGIGLLLGLMALRKRPLRRLAGLVVVGGAAWLALRYAPNERVGSARLAEQTHLAQYGLLSLGYAWVFRRRFQDGALYTTGVLFTTLVGLVDEGVQWWIPDRVGEIADVRLDLAAGILGQLLAALVLFAGERAIVPEREGWATTLRALAGIFLVLGVFVDVVHIGHPVSLPEAGVTFRSRDSAERLERRAAGWTLSEAPAGISDRLLLGEDFYLGEALYHARRRNELLRAGKLVLAFKQEAVLERYYAPCLEAVAELKLPDDTRATLANASSGVAGASYDAGPPELLVAIDRWTWWLAILALAAAAGLGAELLLLRRTISAI